MYVRIDLQKVTFIRHPKILIEKYILINALLLGVCTYLSMTLRLMCTLNGRYESTERFVGASYY